MRPAIAVKGPLSGKPRIATGAPGCALASASGDPSRPETRSTATSFLLSKYTTWARNRGTPPTGSTVVSSWPATTCAAVTTSSGAATHPLPDTPRPHAVPSTFSTDGEACRTDGSARTRGSGAATGADGPLIAGKGSTRASARISFAGGTTPFSPCSTADRCTLSLSPGLPGNWSATEPSTHHRPHEDPRHRQRARDQPFPIAEERCEGDEEEREPVDTGHPRRVAGSTEGDPLDWAGSRGRS